MSQTLTYVMGGDRRAHVDNIQDFKVDFSDDNHNWVQARQFERGMRQVFVNIVNEDGTPFDLTGCNVWFEGLLPKTADCDFRVIDDDGYVPLDPSAGKFRYDMPGHAFTVAGSYRQAFFRILKNNNSVTTLEFDLDVLADKVIDGLVPKTWIGPFDKIADQLVESLQKHTDDADKILADFQKKVGDLIAQLNQQGSTTTSMLTDLRSQMAALQDKINNEHFFTEDEALKFEGEIKVLIKSMQDKLDGFLPDDVINIKQFGAAGDGVTDDSSVFQKAINTGKEIFVPNGIYKIDTMLLPKDESTPLVIHGQTPGKVILKSAQSRIMDFTTAKHLVMSNLSSDNEMHLIDYDPDTNDHTQDRFIQLDNIWNNSADSKVINWNHLVVTPKMDEDPLAGDLKHHSGKYARYPLEIYNNGGFNALNINNSSQSVEASAIGITDYGGKEVPLSSPIILIDQQGQRAYLKVNKKGSDYPSIEAVDNHLAIGAKDSTDDGGIANLKIGEKTWPTIMMVERDSKTNASIVYNKNKFMFVFSNGSPVNVTSEGLQTTREIQIKTNGTEGYTIVREDLDPNKGVKTFYMDSKGQLRVSYGYASNPDSAGGLVQYCQAGPSEQRPKLTSDSNDIGFMFFDRTLGKPIWWTGVDWVSADITAVPLGKQVANLTAQNAELKAALSNLGKQTAQLIADQGKKG